MILEKLNQIINTKYSQPLPSEPFMFNGEKIRWGRHPEKNKESDHMWFYGHEWTFKGDIYRIAYVGSWMLGETDVITSWDKTEVKSKGFHKKAQEEMQVIKHRVDKERAEKHRACRDKWEKEFPALDNIKEHEYLKLKEIKPYCARLSKSGAMVIPLYDQDGIVGVQIIFKQDGKHVKRFSTGVKIKGAICPLKPFDRSDYIYLTEGFATAATIQDIFPDIPVIASMTAGNLSLSIQTIRAINPDVKIIIAADNDESQTGQKAAKNCKRKYNNVIYKIPKFDNKLPDYSDFNDLAIAESVETVKEQLTFQSDDFFKIRCLGTCDGVYYFSSSANPQIIDITAAGMSGKTNLYRITGDLNFWRSNYGIEEEDSDVIKIDWNYAASDLMEKCNKKGLYSPDIIRGLGVWEDKQNIVINCGGEASGIPENSKYFYERHNVTKPNLDRSDIDRHFDFYEGLLKSPTSRPEGALFLVGWHIQAQIFPLLHRRPNIWITGDAGSGKSSIIDMFEQTLPFFEKTTDPTEAGIRQTVRQNQTAVLFDEAEPDRDGRYQKGKTDYIVKMARNCYTKGGGKISRGTSSGKSITYLVECCFMFGSIQIPALNEADKTRTLVVDIVKDKQIPYEEWQKVEKMALELMPYKYDLLPYLVKHIGWIKRAISYTKSKLSKLGLSSRQTDTLGAVIGCASVLYAENGDYTTEIAVDSLMEGYKVDDFEYVERTSTNESHEALNSLLELIVSRDKDTGLNESVANLINSIIKKGSGDVTENISLGHYGMRYYPDTGRLHIQSKNTARNDKLFQYPDIAKILSRNKALDPRKEKYVLAYQGNRRAGISIQLKK